MLRGVLANTVGVISNQVRAICVHPSVELAESADNDAIRGCYGCTCIACNVVSTMFGFVKNAKNDATKKKERWKHIPCFCKCHFVHVVDVPDCVGPGGPADVDDGPTETRVVGLGVGAGVSMASTHTRTQ